MCDEDRLEKKFKCSRCQLLVHERCKSDAPLPCICETPISNVKKPNLQECTSNLPPESPRVPAFLVKCFHELQKQDRLTFIGLYEPIHRDPEVKEYIKAISEKLRRSTNRDLTGVPSFVIACCAKDFLEDIDEQLLCWYDKPFVAMERAMMKGRDRGEVHKWVEERLAELPVASQQTLAAILLHLHQFVRRNPTYGIGFLGHGANPEIQDAFFFGFFRYVIRPIQLLFTINEDDG